MLNRPRRFPFFLAVAAGGLVTLGMALPAQAQGMATAPAEETAGMVGEVSSPARAASS